MNIAQSLDKPLIPHSKKRRRLRRLKVFFNVLMLAFLIASAIYSIYWTGIGLSMVWHEWGAPLFLAASNWLLGLTSAEIFMWLNRLGWGSAVIGALACLLALRRPVRWAYWAAVVCFTYSYAFLWYVLWLVWRSLFDMGDWTENGIIGLAVLCYVIIIRHTYLQRSKSSTDKVPS